MVSTVSREARAGREDVRAPRQVLLHDVVLGGAGEQRRVDAAVLGVGDVEAEQPRRGGVDRHRRVHLVDRDAVEQLAHVAEVGDGHADLADLAGAPRARRGRSRSGSAGRRRSTARSGPWPGWCGRARSRPGPSSGPSRCASPRVGLPRAHSPPPMGCPRTRPRTGSAGSAGSRRSPARSCGRAARPTTMRRSSGTGA